MLGIDPGLRRTGYGVVRLSPGRFEPDLVEAGLIRLDAATGVEDRLLALFNDLEELVERIGPDHIAVEKLFAHYKHPRTAILMAHARGVILLAAKRKGIALTNLPSTEVKKSLTGNGHASKEQVQRAVAGQLHLPAPPEPSDVADALAIAMCCARRTALQAASHPAPDRDRNVS
ncbi:MAG: crossover junction endodeoxyribonuclease RuvC [Phycisphaeraceae bacterium]|nr:crossover junction endodeoxyribonuclease RuvC [Phycisphaeraceae bacterium]